MDGWHALGCPGGSSPRDMGDGEVELKALYGILLVRTVCTVLYCRKCNLSCGRGGKVQTTQVYGERETDCTTSSPRTDILTQSTFAKPYAEL